jgi:ribosomal protein S18 acetylase RimI-like enzyme
MKNTLSKILCILLPYSLYALEIRKANLSNIQGISLLYHEAWHNTYKGLKTVDPDLFTTRTKEKCFKQWLEYYQDKNSFIIVALEDEKIVGVLYAGPLKSKTPDKYAGTIKPRDKDKIFDSEIYKLYLLPSCKHKGIGTQLLKAGLAELKTMNFEKTLVYCLTENKNGCAFYEKKGGVLINAALVVEFNETMNIYTFDLATSCL